MLPGDNGLSCVSEFVEGCNRPQKDDECTVCPSEDCGIALVNVYVRTEDAECNVTCFSSCTVEIAVGALVKKEKARSSWEGRDMVSIHAGSRSKNMMWKSFPAFRFKHSNRASVHKCTRSSFARPYGKIEYDSLCIRSQTQV